jgi:alanyl-tRNA synthetase
MKTTAAYYDYDSGEPFRALIREVRPVPEGLPGINGAAALLLLDRTIFYPEGGGQSADRGTINGFPLLDVREGEDDIWHILSAADATGLSPGDAELRLDAKRRRDFTVHHSAQHLLSGTILRLTGKPTVSMRLGEELCTIDVDAPELSPETLTALEEAVAEAIEEDAPVLIHLCPPERLSDFPLRKTPPQGEAVIRVVEIRGHDFSPCCGTHVKSTGRIGILKILGAEKYKSMTRVSFIAGRRVLREARLLRQNGEIISRALKVPVAETAKGVLAQLEKTARLEAQLKELAEENAQFQAAALLRKHAPAETGGDAGGEGRIITEYFPAADMDTLLRIGRAAQKLTGAALVLASGREAKFAAFCSVKKTDLRPLLGPAMEARGGKGGGGPSFFQGVFPSGEDLAAFLAALPRFLSGAEPGKEGGAS